MADKNSFYGDPFTLPACSFKAPFGKVFDKWDLGKTGDTVTVTGDTVVKALWKDNFTVSSSTVTGGIKVTVTNRTPAAASILVITAAYDSKGRLVSTATVTGKPTAGKGLGVTVPYTSKDGVKAVKVFILDQAASAPLRSVWSKSVS